MHDFVTSYFKFIIGPIFCQGIFLSFLFNLLNKNILILGLGKSGFSVAKLLLKLGAEHFRMN